MLFRVQMCKNAATFIENRRFQEPNPTPTRSGTFPVPPRLREQNMCLLLYFTGIRAILQKKRFLAENEKNTEKNIVFYSPRRDSVNSTCVTFEDANCVYYCILHMQMRFLCIAKTNTKKCDVRFLLCFTALNAIAQNRKLEF